MRILATIAVAIMLALLRGGAADAETRVALVIGNGAYENAPRLSNPRNDAEDVAAALKRSGFETIVGLDMGRLAMEDAAIRFARVARSADVAMFYYSGHAIQVAGVNYLAPIDLKLTDENDLRRMIRLDDIVVDLQQAKNLRILVVDACRDNPLAEELKRSIGATRAMSVQRGLAKIDAPQGMIVAYATQAGRTADDGQGRNSPYTAAFLRHIEAQEEIGTVFRRISADVYEATTSKQLPELSLSVVGEFYLRGKATIGVALVAAPPPVAKPDPCAPAESHWKSAEAIGTIAAFEDHVDRFPLCAFAGLAKSRLAQLRTKAAAAIPDRQVPRAQEAVVIFNNGNPLAVQNRPRRATQFTISEPTRITRIATYHWNDGRGTRTAGAIGLRSSSGEIYGPWRATGQPGQGGVPNAYWVAEPNVELPSGTYTIVDSDPATWAQNKASRSAGFAQINAVRSRL